LSIARDNYCWLQIFKRYENSLLPGVKTLPESEIEEFDAIVNYTYVGDYRAKFYRLGIGAFFMVGMNDTALTIRILVDQSRYCWIVAVQPIEVSSKLACRTP
jgi:hypothetical protein